VTDDYDDSDGLEDPEVTALLRHHAERLTGPIDVDGALWNVQHRARARRRWRAVGSALTAAAAAAAIVFGASVLIGDDDRPTVRTPAAQPAAPSTAPATTPDSTDPSTSPPTTVGPTTTTPPSTDSTTSSSTSTPATPATEPQATPTVPSTTKSTFTSAGGSIVVAVANGAVSLAEDPTPSTGWSYRIDDNGPSRVRVRFEQADERSEIRVDLQGGELVPEITED
jgi:hypothetical protein